MNILEYFIKNIRKFHQYLSWALVGLVFICLIYNPKYNHLESYPTFIVNACLTIITLSFSAILLAMQLASVQFSPRIIRSFFSENAKNQAFFYTFLMGITLCSAIQIYDFDEFFNTQKIFGQPIFLLIAVTYGFILLVVILPKFVFSIMDSINPASITQGIYHNAVKTLEATYSNNGIQADSIRPNDVPIFQIQSLEVGFLTDINRIQIEKILKNYGQYSFYIKPVVGNFISKGEDLILVLGTQYANDISPLDIDQLRKSFVIGKYRSYQHDFLYGIRQLVDIAIKSISPAVNDPTTCVNCIHYLREIVFEYMLHSGKRKSSALGLKWVSYAEIDFEHIIDLAFDQIYQWGKKDIVVVRHLFNALIDLCQNCNNEIWKSNIIKQLQDFEIENSDFENTEYNQIRDKLKASLANL